MFFAKFLFIFAVSASIVYSDAVPRVGGVSKLSGDKLIEAEQVLQTSLTKLAAGDGPHYTLGKIISATHQVVAGSLNKYEVELISSEKVTKSCNVDIWSRPWLENGIEVTFDCPGEEKLVKQHSA